MITTKNKRSAVIVALIVIIICSVMAIVDGVIKANYFYKSLIKLLLFLGVPTLYALRNKDLKIQSLFAIDVRALKFALGMGIGIYIVILGGYFLLKDVIDFSSITTALTGNIGVNRENFLFVSLYISFINSLLEEFFFRGFAFLTLRKMVNETTAYLFSASVFALYHVAMMIGWFSPIVFFLVLLGVFAGGLMFNYLNAKTRTIYPSWLVHMFANFSINTIGFILFGVF